MKIHYLNFTKRTFKTILMCFLFVGFNISVALGSNEVVTFATVTGTITSASDNLPIIGANVLVKGTDRGTISDIDGSFSIEAEPTDILVISYLGFATQEITVGSQTDISIILSEDATALDEVVVIGYGTTTRSHLTGSVSKVSNEKLDQIPLSRVDEALVGQIAGVQIQSTNPAAGEAPAIRVRGQGSISFESSPLIVVDGIAVGTDADFLASIDMNDVESVEVLKDAASSAIYGSRGANGIIMITTKKGESGAVQFNYDSYIGTKSVPDPGYLTTVEDWLQYTRDNNGGQLIDKLEVVDRLVQARGEETDWHKVIMDGGVIHSHALSARGGTDKTKFRASLSYLDDEGVLLTDNFKKINFRLNLDTKVSDKVSFGIMLNPSVTNQRQFPIGFHDAIRQHAWLPLYLDESNIGFFNPLTRGGQFADREIGDYAWERMFDDFDLATGQPVSSGTDISGTSNASALAKVLEREYVREQTKIFANAYVNVNLTDDLFFKQTIGGDYRNYDRDRWDGTLSHRNGPSNSRLRKDNTNRFHLVSESTLNFNKRIDKHDFGVVAGMAYEEWNDDYQELVANSYANDIIRVITAANLTGASADASEEKLISYLSRLNYSFDDKYLLSLSARWDGSSKFGPDRKFGFFPAASVGWRVSEEDFLRDNDFIDNLKIRASYGVTGSNSGIGEYDHIGLVEPISTGFGVNGFNAVNISNPNLGWEKLVELNAGLDLAFINGRVGLSFDYYNRRSEDLLLNLPVPSVTGFTSALVNQGEVENKGFELEIKTVNVTNRNFSWSTSALLTHNKNTLVDFAGASGLISTVDSKRPAEWIALEGNPISSFYGYVVDREIPLEFIRNPFYPINGQSQDIYVRDLNGDGLIDTDDRTILGSPYPDLIWSLNNNLTISNFDVGIMFQGSHGAEVRNISSQYVKQEFSSNQDYSGDFADADLVQQRIFTSDDIQDASYIALRNLNIGYTFPRSVLENIGLSRLRVYIGGQNLLYIMSDDYEGYNPEGIDTGGSNTPLTYGYQRGPAPIFRTLSAGINVGF